MGTRDRDTRMDPEAASASKSQVGPSNEGDGDPTSVNVGEDWVKTGGGDLMPREDDIEASIRENGTKDLEGIVFVNESSGAPDSEPPMEVAAEAVAAGSEAEPVAAGSEAVAAGSDGGNGDDAGGISTSITGLVTETWVISSMLTMGLGVIMGYKLLKGRSWL